MGSVFVYPWLVVPLEQGCSIGSFRLARSAMGRLLKKEAPLEADNAKAKEPNHRRRAAFFLKSMIGSWPYPVLRTLPYPRPRFLSSQKPHSLMKRLACGPPKSQFLPCRCKDESVFRAGFFPP
jgi:hypothetical protein